MKYVIECDNLTRHYQTYKKSEGIKNSIKGFFNREYIQKVALKPTNLNLEGGEVIGLIGANGAGKTTLLKLLSGLIYPSNGQVKVLGSEPFKRNPDFLKRMSLLLGQKNQLWWDLPALDSFQLLTQIYDLDSKQSKKRIYELAEMLKCKDLLEIQLRRLSLGERMKMELIGSLLHQPEVLFLDEPTIGLDIVAQDNIRDFLNHYVQENKPTIILTSHYMDDITSLASHLLLMSQGEIVYNGRMKNFIDQSVRKQKVILQFEKTLVHDFVFKSKLLAAAGSKYLQAEILMPELGEILEQLLKLTPIRDIKIEEVDFEEVIRQFLQKNSQ